ncbi:MAG TPA: hypothetical protein VN229_20535 [Terriglobales bacterium]|nr:hypothetical protein [Terriglobales bacterium]
MKFDILPLKGIGEVEFGMHCDVARRLMRGEFRSFKRTPEAAFPSDYFRLEGVFFYYDSDGCLEAIEFASPAKVMVRGSSLLGMPFNEALEILTSLDGKVEKEIDGAVAHQLGVTIYAPLAKEDAAAPVESVLAFKSGYYD